MSHTSLFGHLAARFSSSPENLATEALNYILKNQTARKALLVCMKGTGLKLSDDLSFSTQSAGKDGSIPDMVGFDGQGREVVIVEAKFWAGLTENQPNAYLERLPADAHGILLFLAPYSRFPTLWPELQRLCDAGGHSLTVEPSADSNFVLGSLNDNHKLGLLSWRHLLACLLNAVDAEGIGEVASDIRQLQGLCDRMDEKGFHPLSPGDLSSGIGRRIGQYCSIVDDITTSLAEEEFATTKGLRASAGSGYYGRYISIHRMGCFLACHFTNWARYRETPLWLYVKDHEWKLSPEIKEALQPLTSAEPPRVIFDDATALVPLFLPTGVEREAVVESIIQQINETMNHLAHLRPEAESEDAAPPTPPLPENEVAP